MQREVPDGGILITYRRFLTSFKYKPSLLHQRFKFRSQVNEMRLLLLNVKSSIAQWCALYGIHPQTGRPIKPALHTHFPERLGRE